VPTGLLASTAFNAYPVALHIASVREQNRSLFKMLAEAEAPDVAAGMFEAYMATMFDLDDQDRDGRGPARFRASSYLRLLRGWGYEANSPEGAVLKGWVESRFGLFPTFHKAPIDALFRPGLDHLCRRKNVEPLPFQCDPDPARSALRILPVVPRPFPFRRPKAHHAVPRHQQFRGAAADRAPRQAHVVVRLNSLCRSPRSASTAESFGDIILEVEAPTVKILFFNSCCPNTPSKARANSS
jgi:NAD+--dinitrogen-reductase ADP-D-ribosyltransferase